MDRVIVEHADGRRFSVPADDPRATGAEDGWTVEGEETDASFVVTGVPKPKRSRTRPRAKAAAPVAVAESEADAEPEPEV